MVSLPTRERWSERWTPTSRPTARTALREADRRVTSPSSQRIVSAVVSPMPKWRCDEMDVVTEALATRNALFELGVE